MGALKIFDGVKWVSIGGGERGERGPQGNGIDHAVLNPDYTLTLFWTNGTSSTYGPIRGEQGAQGETGDDGNGIASVTWIGGTHAAGTEDTYRITFTDGTHFDFGVYNGNDGQGSAGSQVPLPDGGNGSAGTANAYSREDHQHPASDALIWTNPSPDASFSNQTLSLDLSGYRFVEIEIKPTGSYAGNFVIQKIAVGGSGLLHVPYFTTISGNDRLCIAKRLAAVSTAGITFSATARWIYNGETTGMNFAIPTRIWGIR